MSIDSKSALQKTILLSKQINTFLSKQEPWKKTNKEYTNEDITVSYIATICLVFILEPVIPTISLQLNEQLHAGNFHIDFRKDLPSKWIKNIREFIQLPKLKKILQPLIQKDLEKSYKRVKRIKNQVKGGYQT